MQACDQPPVQPDHDELVARAIRGDDQAWRRLVHQYKRLVYSIPHSYRMPEELCDDVFQNVFIALVRELPKIKDPRSLPKWLITSTHRECWRLSAQNRESRLGNRAPEMSRDATERDLDVWRRRQRLEESLLALGGRCEKLLRMLYQTSSQVPYDQVAECMDMPLGSIGPTRSRCLAKLATLFGGSQEP